MTFDRVITIQKIILALLIILILGAIFLVPNIFMFQFYTFSALWTIAGIMIIFLILYSYGLFTRRSIEICFFLMETLCGNIFKNGIISPISL